MKYFKLIILSLLFGYVAQGQNKNMFMGFVKIQDTVVITYKVEFEESKGVISGYSLTDFGGEHETKSKISGTYDKENSLLTFQEVELIYTKSTFSEQDFCNIYLEPTKFKLGGTKLIGNFKGKFNDGTECINGEIALNSIEKIDKRVTKFTKKLKNSKRVPDSIKQQLDNIKFVDTLNLNVLKKGEITSVLTSSEKVKLLIYDGGKIDDDVITIKKNGKVILPKYRISEQKEVLEIVIDSNEIDITIISESIGSIGTNTAVIEIVDENNSIRTMTNLEKGETTQIHFIKKAT